MTYRLSYRAFQKGAEIRAGVDANARNKICFGVNATDAKSMAAMAPELAQEDFMALPRYYVYASFNQDGRNTGWVSGQTLPMTIALNSTEELKKRVAIRYGKPGAEVESEYLKMLTEHRPENDSEIDSGPVGRRKIE